MLSLARMGGGDAVRFLLRVALLSLIFHATSALSQDRVAEGEYRVEGVTASGAPVIKTVTRWVLYGEASGGFRLESQIDGQRAGMRVIQIEHLTDQLVPTAIGYDLYRKDQQIAGITANCDFSAGSIICTGSSGKDQAAPSAPYKPGGPFWMWIEGLSSLDVPWLLDGVVNMAHLDKGQTKIEILVVSGGTGVMIGDAINIAALETIGKPLTVIAPDKPIPWG